MSGTLSSLFCWVIDTPIKQIFPVPVRHDMIWGKVKKKIKKEMKNEFANIDANTLDLWKMRHHRFFPVFSLGIRRLLEERYGHKLTQSHGSLSTECKDPLPDGHINIIIVQRPTPAGRPDIKGKRKAEAEPDTDHEQHQRNVGAPGLSEALFYNKWAKWETKFSEYKLTSTFAWIVETEIYWAEIAKQTRETRQTTQVITPEYRQAVIPLVNVHTPLAKELARIRKGNTPSDSFGGLSMLNPPNQVAQTQMIASSSKLPMKRKPMKPSKASTARFVGSMTTTKGTATTTRGVTSTSNQGGNKESRQ